MKISYSHLFLRLFSLAATAALWMIELCRDRAFTDFARALPGLVAGNIILLMYPDSTQGVRSSLLFSLAAALPAAAIVYFLGDSASGISSMAAVFALYTACRALRRLRAASGPAADWTPWNELEAGCGHLYAVAVLCCAAASLTCLSGRPLLAGACASMLLALYVLQLLRAVTGRTMLMSRRREKRVRELTRSAAPRPSAPVDPREQSRMNSLFSRVTDYMESRRPYLDEDFKVKDMAMALYTNKVYLSRTINACSGRNFCQFVNSYRINYAVELIRKDPRLKVFEVSMMSGFHSLVSFNMAFKLFLNESPLEYMTKVREERITPLSRKTVREP